MRAPAVRTPAPELIATLTVHAPSGPACDADGLVACDACNRRVARKAVRFCHYEGRWFCTRKATCFARDRFVIPARVLQLQDYKAMPVSVRANAYLAQASGRVRCVCCGAQQGGVSTSRTLSSMWCAPTRPSTLSARICARFGCATPRAFCFPSLTPCRRYGCNWRLRANIFTTATRAIG